MRVAPLETKIRELLFLIFVLFFLGVSLVAAYVEYVEARNGYYHDMGAQVQIAQDLVTDYILKYDDHFLQIVNQCPVEEPGEVAAYLNRVIHFHDIGDIYFLLDRERRIVMVAPSYQSYQGVSLAQIPFFSSPDKISPVHQSLFSNKSVVSLQYPLRGGMVLVVERDITNITKAMSFFEEGKIFPRQTMFILTTEGTVAYHPNTELVKSRHNLAFEMKQWSPPLAGGFFTYRLHGEKFYALRQDFEIPRGWIMYFSVPGSLLFRPIVSEVFSQLVIVLAFLGGFYLVLQNALSRYFSRPVQQLVSSLEGYDWPRKVKVAEPEQAHGVREFARIIEAVNAMATQISRANRQLMAGEQRIRLLLNSTAEAICGLDTNGRCTFCNQSFLFMTGYREETELLGREIHTLIHHSRPDGSSYPVEECVSHRGFRDGQAAHVESEVFWRADGTNFPVEYWFHPIFENNRVSGAVVTFIDISQRKEAEERLAAEKERLAVTLRSIGDAVITTDTSGRVVLVNEVAEKLTGWEHGEARGKRLEEIFCIIDSRDRKPMANPVTKVLESKEIVELANHAVLISRDGTERSIADSGAPIRDNGDNVIGVVLVFRDVTVARKMQEEMIKAKKLESVGVLAGGIAHDFNNILTAIMGNISLAHHQALEGSEIMSLLASAEKAAIRAKGLTQQLLTFAKGGDPVTETASIAEVIRESAGFVLHGSNVACHFAIPDDLWLVRVDKGQMSQVIQNIVMNAQNAMPEGGTVSISCGNREVSPEDHLPLTPGRYVTIDIKDSGTGIPPANLERIFDPYFTTRELGQGLGLAITRAIVVKHDGHIVVESREGVGSTFTIFLPASNSVPGLNMTEDLVPPATGKGRILVMDDEGVVREVAERMLTYLGYEVSLAGSGEEMLELYGRAAAEGRSFAAVVLDLTIPGGMGGREAIRRLLGIDPGARAVVASGYFNDPVMADYAEYGFQGAVAKPFKFGELASVIQKVLA